MYYDEFHNHKWALVLKQARELAQSGEWQAFYRGLDLVDGDVFPGVKVCLAYWISVEHEMKLRMRILLKGAGLEEWELNPSLNEKMQTYHDRFVSDMAELTTRYGLLTTSQFEQIKTNGWETPKDWTPILREKQQHTEAQIENGRVDPDLVEWWLSESVRSVSNYNRYLIWGGVNAAELVKQRGQAGLKEAVDRVAEEFMWEVSREFFARVMPAAGFEDLGDLMELGLRGMYADNYITKKPESTEGEKTIRTSLLNNCQLMGIYRRIEEWENLPPTSLGYGICQFCEAHGQATMLISIPPMYAPTYRRLQSLGLKADAEYCEFELVTVPADDMDRIFMVQQKLFGEEA